MLQKVTEEFHVILKVMLFRELSTIAVEYLNYNFK